MFLFDNNKLKEGGEGGEGEDKYVDNGNDDSKGESDNGGGGGGGGSANSNPPPWSGLKGLVARAFLKT